ncbi:MAG: dTDP-4-dehydrorhamnose reductase [Candidatus Methanomethylophilaceae archaeon]|nr:dTDP-4-dehydrorhamnose reductase [Candidatus Methanomethylophilaceae archaeon]
MRILVTGVGGQLGHDCSIVLGDRGHDVLAPTHSELDICDPGAVDSYFDVNRPGVVIHCAAYTAVDKAEDETELCRKVNVDGTRNIAVNCARYDIPMVYISTDYVFNGSGDRPWEPDDATEPINAYGLSKRDGETEVLKNAKHFIVRISWVFGINGNNFIKTMRRLSETRDTVNVVDDQYGSPTYTKDLAELLADMIVTDRYGIYHAHNEGVCTWADVAEETFRDSGLGTKVNRITTDQYPMKAKRPMNSRMTTDLLVKNGFRRLPDWKDALARYISELDG